METLTICNALHIPLEAYTLMMERTEDDEAKEKLLAKMNEATAIATVARQAAREARQIEEDRVAQTRALENAKLVKHRALIERRIKKIAKLCPACGAAVKHFSVPAAKDSAKEVRALFCTGTRCTRSRGAYADATMALQPDECKRRMVLEDGSLLINATPDALHRVVTNDPHFGLPIRHHPYSGGHPPTDFASIVFGIAHKN